MGGEKFEIKVLCDIFLGSPPRGRGKVAPVCVGGTRSRITPAWAGKSFFCVLGFCFELDHPRVGGEKRKPRAARPPAPGSPPRGRGKGNFSPPFDNPKRITPAWAGKSYVFGPLRPGSWDHPRVGGEKRKMQRPTLAAAGSPPRGRGKGMAATVALKARRITPAWVGKSCCLRRAALVLWDHPRVGGEKTKKIP